jgi:hypothetical protein
MAVLKRTLPTAIAIAIGLFVLISVFTSVSMLDGIGKYFVDMAIIVAAFALFLGLLNVLRVHARKIRDRQPGRMYSFVLILSMLIVLVVGLPPLPNQPSGPAHPTLQWIFDNIQAPIQASFSALIVFFMVTAAYRLFRLRNLESVLMLAVAVVVLIGQVSVGLLPVLSELKDWILTVPAMAGVRGILLGVALGAVLTGIRLLLGVERPYSD